MIPVPEFGRYPTHSGDEFCFTFKTKNAPQVLFIEPFFEERNFLRRTVTMVAGHIAEHGIGSVIPDLPGCGESLRTLTDVRLADWRHAIADASAWLRQQSDRPIHIVAFRSGALLDDAADGDFWWRFAPADGADLLRLMRRAASLGDDKSLSGYDIDPELLNELEQSRIAPPPGPLRECVVGQRGAPLWRRAEPAEDPQLTQALADDLLAWIGRCAQG
jgi:pimeloyl-ACP methyl ester carboxylesterase